MATILVKGLSKETLKQLKRLKAELDCKSWAELLEKLSTPQLRISATREDISEMKKAVKEFTALSSDISSKWSGSRMIVEEFRKSRRHERG